MTKQEGAGLPKEDLFEQLAKAMEGQNIQVTFTGWKSELEYCEKLLKAEREKCKLLREALKKIRDHFIPYDVAPPMATQNHYLKDIARDALKEDASAEGEA